MPAPDTDSPTAQAQQGQCRISALAQSLAARDSGRSTNADADANAAPPGDAAAADSSAGTNADAAAQWLQALQLNATLPTHSRLSEHELATLARGCEQPLHLQQVLELFSRYAENLSSEAAALPANRPFAQLAEYVDDSRHDLAEWTRALHLFLGWLAQQERGEQPLLMLLSYLSCTAQAQAATPLPLSLPHLLADMLELYGYDGDASVSHEPEA